MNYLATLLAVVSALAVGFVWYHPKVFGTAWMKSLGITEADARSGNMALMYGMTALLSAVITMPLAYSVDHNDDHLSPFAHGFYHGAVYYGLMVALPVVCINGIFDKKSLTGVLISAGYWVLTLGVMAGVLAVMRGHV
jgi:hypothetical protein